MRLRHAGPYSLQCYACQVRVDRQGSMTEKRLARWERYEQMVEYIETLPRGAEIWRPILDSIYATGNASIPKKD